MARLLAPLSETPTGKAFTYFAMFCSMPIYVMLWKGQLHVFIILSVTLVLAGLARLEQDPGRSDRYLRWIQLRAVGVAAAEAHCGDDASRALRAAGDTPEATAALAVYAALSLLFLLVPRLNLGGYNGVHWLHVLNMSFRPTPIFNAVFPHEQDLTHHPEVYSLVMYLYRMGAGPAITLVSKLPIAAVALMSLAPCVLPGRADRIRAAIVAVLVCILAQNLCYYQTWEYHYTTLLPLLPAMLWLWRQEGRESFAGC